MLGTLDVKKHLRNLVQLQFTVVAFQFKCKDTNPLLYCSRYIPFMDNYRGQCKCTRTLDGFKILVSAS